MVDFTASINAESENIVNQKPRNTTLDIIRQYARVCTPLPKVAFSKMIAN